MPKFDDRYPTLSAKQLKAAMLLAADEMPDERIAEQCKVGRTTLHEWKKDPEFARAVREKVAALDAAVSQLQFVKRRNRIEFLNRQIQDYEVIVAERAQWFLENEPDVPGGKTGRITRTERIIGTGKASTRIVEYAADTKLDSHAGNVLKQIAQERGEWAEKRELSGPGGTPLLPITEVEIVKQAAPPVDDDDGA